MTAPADITESTSTGVATTPPPSASAIARASLSPERQAMVDEARARNAMATMIRGANWSKELGDAGSRGLAEYCRRHHIDPVRHIDILGGNVYLNADFYDDRAAPLIQRGVLIPHQVEFINADKRLDELAKAGDEWAKGEVLRRMKARIEHNVPEGAVACAVQRFTLTTTGREVVGVNWCGGGSRKGDPVGESEPTKTAETRARRRALIKITEVMPEYGAQFVDLHAELAQISEVVNADVITERSKAVADAALNRPRSLGAGAGDPYAAALSIDTPMPTVERQQERIAQSLAEPDPYGNQEPAATRARDIFDDEGDEP